MTARLIISALFLAQSGSANAADLTERETQQAAVRLNSLALPDEVAPAVFPYVLCLQTAAGIPVFGPDGEQANNPDEPTDCARVREKAISDGVAMLEVQGLGEDELEQIQYVETVLTAIEEFARPRADEELQEIYKQEPVILE